ncbi:DUF2797 domain-containing protein [Streptomyces sp. NPDC086091]|uniref:DUF2797 domain-containing protein n=1 Tax=Streptomyces sp. NPDC086091 TaxID=3365751 RepID=UPI0037F34D55
MGRAWRCAGLRWSARGPELAWDGGPRSALTWGKRVAFGVADGGGRRCVGARGHPCPVRAAVSARTAGARCEECGRLDRAHSVAADGIADDPRPYRVYLAWFGPGLVKVGITGVGRGPDRLLEQGAVSFSWLGTGPLMAARRTEELLRAALRVPDRIPYGVKRAVRAGLPPGEAERAAEIRELHARAVRLDGWPETLAREPFRPVDHLDAFGLAGTPAAVAEVTELVPGGRVGGDLVAAAGPDLHLSTARGVVVLDTRLLRGWELVPARAEGAAGTQDGAGAAGPAGGDGAPPDGTLPEVTLPVRDLTKAAAPLQDELF